MNENKGVLVRRRPHFVREFGVKLLFRFRRDAQQHHVFVRVLAELKPPDRGPLNVSHAMVARDADIQRAKMQGLVQLPVSSVKIAGSAVAGGLAVDGLENPHHSVIFVSASVSRSEERRVGKEGRSRWS